MFREGSIRRSSEHLVPGSSKPRSAGCREGRRSAGDRAVAAFRAALVLDIRQHRLAWSVIVAGAISSAMLWASIAGLPLARPASFDLPDAPLAARDARAVATAEALLALLPSA
jgi:hypothetical protein